MGRLLLAAALAFLAACSRPETGRPKLASAGRPAPEIRLPVLLNSPLKSLAGWQDVAGKAVVLEFWATWCDPCVDSLPELNALAESFRGKPVVFISVTDESAREVQAFLRGHRMDAWVAPEAGPEVFKSFRVYGRPHTVLIDRDGRVAAFTSPSALTAGTLERLLAGRLRPDEGADAALHAGEDAGPGPGVLADFHIARASGAASVTYRRDYFQARAVTLRQALGFLLGSPDRLDLGPGTRELVDASYDIRLVAPTAGPDRKPELFSRGLAFALGLKVEASSREEEVYVLRRLPGAASGVRKAPDFADISFDGVTLKAAGASFAVLASRLAERLGRPVLDETREEGPLAYSFTFETLDPGALDAQLRRDLGLRLEKARRRIRVVAVRK